MSRIIVKNLPKKVTKEQITSHFSQVGQTTDVNLKYKENGEFRGFAFIGYESEEVAMKALKQFSNTYYRKSKIVVEKCLELDHKLKEKEAKKTEKNSIKNQNRDFKYALKMKDEMTTKKLNTLMQNSSFIQYLKLNKKGTADLVDTLKKKYGEVKQNETNQDKENEDEEDEEKEEEEKKEEEKPKQEKLANRNISDVEYLQCLMKSSSDKGSNTKEKKDKAWKNLFTVVIRSKEQLTKEKTFTKRGIKDFFRPLTIQSLRIPRRISFMAYVGFKTEKAMNKALQNDRSFLDGVQVRVHKLREASGDSANKEETPWKAAEEKLLKEAKPVVDSGKLFVRNLWYSVTEDDLKNLFEKIGPLADVTLPVSKLTQRPKGFAHVTFVFPEHAIKAINELDGKDFKGRLLHILPSLNMEEDENDTEEKNYQKKKKEEQKKKASTWHDWNSLFIASGAVIDLMAKQHNMSKYKILDDEKNISAAVSMAISETQIVEETKRMLEENGVCLNAFSNPNMQRSSTVLLAKNLPANTAASELKEVFGKFGELGRIVLPPSGVTAIIEFLNPSEAKRAYRDLVYTRFKYLPLYLEWAPFEVFSSPPVKKSDNEDLKKHNEGESKPGEDRTPEDDTTLYVKNLNFKTDENTLREHFLRIGEICSVMIAKRQMLSLGYGFVQFFKTSDANKALRVLQNTTLDGHALTLKKSEKKLVSQSSKSVKMIVDPGEPTTAKILIKNIPFQATYKEIKDLFEPAGQIKLVRLPKKFDSSEHRGFGFIEFMSREQAKKAMVTFGASTHLYGRRLVLEWAKEDETVEELRSKTANRFLASGPPKKKLKIDALES